MWSHPYQARSQKPLCSFWEGAKAAKHSRYDGKLQDNLWLSLFEPGKCHPDCWLFHDTNHRDFNGLIVVALGETNQNETDLQDNILVEWCLEGADVGPLRKREKALGKAQISLSGQIRHSRKQFISLLQGVFSHLANIRA